MFSANRSPSAVGTHSRASTEMGTAIPRLLMEGRTPLLLRSTISGSSSALVGAMISGLF